MHIYPSRKVFYGILENWKYAKMVKSNIEYRNPVFVKKHHSIIPKFHH
jgi:hypothetical protein